jgi:hypothetical protein
VLLLLRCLGRDGSSQKLSKLLSGEFLRIRFRFAVLKKKKKAKHQLRSFSAVVMLVGEGIRMKVK